MISEPKYGPCEADKRSLRVDDAPLAGCPVTHRSRYEPAISAVPDPQLPPAPRAGADVEEVFESWLRYSRASLLLSYDIVWLPFRLLNSFQKCQTKANKTKLDTLADETLIPALSHITTGLDAEWVRCAVRGLCLRISNNAKKASKTHNPDEITTKKSKGMKSEIKE